MTLSSALVNALGGLRAAQTGVQWASQNIGNVNTPGYTKKVVNQQSQVTGGVRVTSIERSVDAGLAQELTREQSTLGRMRVGAEYAGRLSDILGTPGDGGHIASSISDLMKALEALAADPAAAQNPSLTRDRAKELAGVLNTTTNQIQELRREVDGKIAASIDTINGALQEIDGLNIEIMRRNASSIPAGDLEDQRDVAVQRIANEVPIKVFSKENGQIGIFLQSGASLLDGAPRYLADYQALTAVDAQTESPAKFSKIAFANQPASDVRHMLQGGELGALIEMRDTTLPQAQAQADNVAVELRDQLNRIHNRGTPMPPPETVTATNAFSATDIQFSFTGGSDTEVVVFDKDGHEVGSIKMSELVTSSPTLPSFSVADIGNPPAGHALDGVLDVSVDADGHLSFSVAGANAGYGIGLADVPPAGQEDATIAVADGGGGPSVEKQGFSALFGFNDLYTGETEGSAWASATYTDGARFGVGSAMTANILTPSGNVSVALPEGASLEDIRDAINGVSGSDATAEIYVEGGKKGLRIAPGDVLSVEITNGSQRIEFSRNEPGAAGRIELRQEIADDANLLVKGRPVQDSSGSWVLQNADGAIATQMAELFDKAISFAPTAGIGRTETTFTDYTARLVGTISSQAAKADSDLTAQESFAALLETRISEVSGVNIDEELTQVIKLQNAYSASARVINVINEMYDILDSIAQG